MFVLLNIESLPDDIQSLPANATHKLTFKAVFTIKGVPDSFTGMVLENAAGELQVEHFNNPRGNRRKVITLKNKLAPGAFDQIRQWLYAKSRGESVSYPQQLNILQRQAAGSLRS